MRKKRRTKWDRSSNMLRNAGVNITDYLSVSFNRLYDTGTFSSEWSKSVSVAITQEKGNTNKSGPFKRSGRSVHTYSLWNINHMGGAEGENRKLRI